MLNFILNIDHQINLFFYAIRNPWLIKFFHLVTFLGETPTVLLLTLIISYFLWKKKKKLDSILLWLVVLGSQACTYATKIFFNRQRPPNAALFESTPAFPSGHATIAIAMFGFLTFLLLQQIKNKIQRFFIILTSLLLIILIGFSRLYLGVHYLSDVIVGYLIGGIWLFIGIKYHKLLWKK